MQRCISSVLSGQFKGGQGYFGIYYNWFSPCTLTSDAELPGRGNGTLPRSASSCNLLAVTFATLNSRRKAVRKELQISPRNRKSFIHPPPPPTSSHFMDQVFLSAKEDVNDLINILNNSIGKDDISQSFWSTTKVMKVASYSCQAYKGLKFTPCLKKVR